MYFVEHRNAVIERGINFDFSYPSPSSTENRHHYETIILHLMGKLWNEFYAFCVCLENWGKMFVFVFALWSLLNAWSYRQINKSTSIAKFLNIYFHLCSCVCYLHKWWFESLIIHKTLRYRNKMTNIWMSLIMNLFIIIWKWEVYLIWDARWAMRVENIREREEIDAVRMARFAYADKINIIQRARWKWTLGILNENRSTQMSYDLNARAGFFIPLLFLDFFSLLAFNSMPHWILFKSTSAYRYSVNSNVTKIHHDVET